MKRTTYSHTGIFILSAFLLVAAPPISRSMAKVVQDAVHSTPGIEGLEQKSVKPAADLSIWDSEQFQKAFMGSYGVNAEIEPRVTAVEREQMQKVMDTLSKEDSMEKAMKQLMKFNKKSASAIFDFTIGNLYFQQQQLSEALTFYNQALKKFPDFRRACKNAGLVHMRNGDFRKALPFLTRTIELGGHTSLAYGLLGFAYDSSDKHVHAESAYRMAVLLNPEAADWQLGLARSLFRQQKYGETVSLCSTLIERDPDQADFWLLQANAHLGLKQPMRAAESYEYVNLIGKATPESMTMLADIYVNEECLDLAADAYLRAFEIDSGKDPSKPLRAAKILAARGALDQASRIVNRMSEHESALEEPNLKELLKLQARVAVAKGGGKEVARILEEVVALDPLDGEALLLLAQYYSPHAPEKAVFYYERAANMQQYEAEAKLRHGQLLVRRSKYHDAIPLLRRALELQPRSDVEDYLRQVERIEKSRR